MLHRVFVVVCHRHSSNRITLHSFKLHSQHKMCVYGTNYKRKTHPNNNNNSTQHPYFSFVRLFGTQNIQREGEREIVLSLPKSVEKYFDTLKNTRTCVCLCTKWRESVSVLCSLLPNQSEKQQKKGFSSLVFCLHKLIHTHALAIHEGKSMCKYFINLQLHNKIRNLCHRLQIQHVQNWHLGRMLYLQKQNLKYNICFSVEFGVLSLEENCMIAVRTKQIKYPGHTNRSFFSLLLLCVAIRKKNRIEFHELTTIALLITVIQFFLLNHKQNKRKEEKKTKNILI